MRRGRPPCPTAGRRLADGGHAADVREPEPGWPGQGQVRRAELLQPGWSTRRRRRRRPSAVPRARRRRPRRRVALRTRVREFGSSSTSPTRTAYLAIVQAYNTWLADYIAVAPDRLIGNALMPVSGIDYAINEIEPRTGTWIPQRAADPAVPERQRGAVGHRRRPVLGARPRIGHGVVTAHVVRWRDRHKGGAPSRHVGVAGRSGHDPALPPTRHRRPRWRR